MKAYEVLFEYKIEKPAGMFQQGLKKAGAAALGALGAKHAADALQGSADIGDRANAYEKEFQKYLQSKGKDTIDIEYADLNNFIKQNTLPSPKLPIDGYVADGDLEHIFTDIAKLSAKGAASASQQTKPSTDAAQASTQQQAKPAQTTAPIEKPSEPAATPTTAPKGITPDELTAAFQEYVNADGKFTPEIRKAVRELWFKMGGIKIESVKKAKVKL